MIVWFTPSRIDGARQRQLDLAQYLALRRPERHRGLHAVRGDLADPQIGQADARRQARRRARRSRRGPGRPRTRRSPGPGRRTAAASASRRGTGGGRAGRDRSAPTRYRGGSRSRRRAPCATITWLRVSIAMSHIPNDADGREQDERERPPSRRSETPPTPQPRHPAQTIHHGSPSSRFRSGSSAYFTVDRSVIALVTPPIVRVIHSTTSFTGFTIENVHPAGKSCWRSTCRPITIAAADQHGGDRSRPPSAAPSTPNTSRSSSRAAPDRAGSTRTTRGPARSRGSTIPRPAARAAPTSSVWSAS